MKYLFEETELNPVELEKQLGLERGAIKELTIYPEGAIEVDTADELNPADLIKLKEALKLHSLPRGKKPPH